MALTPAQKQQHYRDKLKTQAQGRPEAVEGALVQAVARCEKLSSEERTALANKLADIAMRHLRRAQELAKLAQKARPPGWNPFPDLSRIPATTTGRQA